MSIGLVILSNHHILCHPFLLLPSIFLSIRAFTYSYQVAKVLELQHQSFQWIFRTDFLWDWLVWSLCRPRDSQESSQATQFESINSSVSTFFMVKLSHPYINSGKTIALTIWTFVDKMMSLLFYMLSRFVIAFFPRNKPLLISWLQSQSIVILEPRK